MADVEKLKEQKRQLEARIKKIESLEKSKKRKEDTRRKIIIGGAMLAYAAGDPSRKEKLYKILGQFITNPKDRDVVGLSVVPQEPSSSAPITAAPPSAAVTDTPDTAAAGGLKSTSAHFEIKPDTDI